MKPKLILASGSFNRIQALKIGKIPFKSIPADIDEKSIKHSDIHQEVVLTAKAKVEKIAQNHQGIILGADGVNLVGRQVFGKPQNRRQAKQMLQAQSGNTSSFLTGFYLLNTRTDRSYQGTSETLYRLRRLTTAEINQYLDTEPYHSWAAAFSPLNSFAIRFVTFVKGSPSNFAFSLPLELLIPIFIQEGVI